ncbi:MAG: hypothetical protein IKK33_17025 [Lachnospiraceae bacterium]|nr:hypothetical protein [Lachnospiraceae bacterium]
MNQNDLRKTPLVLLKIALVLVVIYLIGTFALVMKPEVFIKLVTVGYEGGYSMPFDSIHLGVALITTILFGFMYTLLTVNIKKNNELGLGFGIMLGGLSYIAYFISKSMMAELLSRWIDSVKNDQALIATWKLGVEANLVCYKLILGFHEIIGMALSTAIVLLLVAYGIYSYRKREQSMPKRLYR